VLRLGTSANATFDVAPSGHTLGYTGGTIATTLWAIDLDARSLAPRRLAYGTAWIGNPFLSSDGQFVGYERTDQDGDNVYVLPFDPGPGRPLTNGAAEWEAQGWIPGGHQMTYSGFERPTKLYAQEFPDGQRRPIGRAGALPLADGGTVELDARRGLVFRTAVGMERAVPVADSLGGFVRLWAADADGGGAYLLGVPAAAGAQPRSRVVRVDRESGNLTGVVDLPFGQVPYVLAAQHGTVVYATWVQGRDGLRPIVWRVMPRRSPQRVVELPRVCGEGTLTMGVNGRRFACAERTTTTDLFLIENFDRYRPHPK
jgi:hypothetical protein